MFVPITSEVTLETGMIVKQISTGLLYRLGERLKNDPNVSGDDPWQMINVDDRDDQHIAVGYLELTEKYFAEVED